jgi:hypothetical protein
MNLFSYSGYNFILRGLSVPARIYKSGEQNAQYNRNTNDFTEAGEIPDFKELGKLTSKFELFIIDAYPARVRKSETPEKTARMRGRDKLQIFSELARHQEGGFLVFCEDIVLFFSSFFMRYGG